MDQNLCETPAGLVAVIVAAQRTGDRVLAASALKELRRRYGITLRFDADKSPEPQQVTA